MFELEYNKIKQHALEEYPKECCGLIINNKYIKQKNIAKDPIKDFEMHPMLLVNNDVQAVVHSHTAVVGTILGEATTWDLRTASYLDMKNQIETNIPWGIVGTNGSMCQDPVWFGSMVPITELVGRDFIHGIYDCYSLIYDYYKLTYNIALPQQPRNPNWWDKGLDLYSDNFKKAGFEEINISQAQAGDVFLLTIQSKVINHAAVYIGDNLILHHLANRLSRREPLSRWNKYINKCIRYTDK